MNLHSTPMKWRKVLLLFHSLDGAPPIPTVDTARMADRVARKMRKVFQEAPPRRRIEAEGAEFEIDLRGFRAPRCDDSFIPLIE